MDAAEPMPARGLPIQEASRLLGVPAPTMRAWERRYGVPDTPRSPGGHRRYSTEALQQVRLMRDEVARGRRAGDAAQAVRELVARAGPARAQMEALLEASQRLEPAVVRAVLDRSVEQLGLDATVDDVLMPAMRQVGQWWATGRCDIAQERFTTEAARGWLSRLTAFAPAPVHERPVVLACGPRDLHTLGLEALGALLSYRGRACRVLGARTPASTLVAAVSAGAAGVVVVSHLSVGRRPAVETIRAVATTGVPIFSAGNAFLFPAARQDVPATYLGERLGEAAQLIETTLTA